MLTRLKTVILDILFPPICLYCRKHSPGKNLCDLCLSRITINTAPYCPVCRGRLPAGSEPCHPKAKYLLAAASSYDDPVLQAAIHSFKYDRLKTMAEPMGKLLIEYLDTLIGNLKLDIRNFIIIPIPLHPARKRKRGFNQSFLLGREVGNYFGIPVMETMERTINNKPQVEQKNYEIRKKNMQGVFKIKDRSLIQNKNIILVDDVSTSGATMEAAVAALKDSGARKIIALVLAKT